MFPRIQQNLFVASRLDFFLLSNSLRRETVLAAIRSSIKSDHRIVKIRININPVIKGPGYWKLNNWLLYDVNYIALIRWVIEHFKIRGRPYKTSAVRRFVHCENFEDKGGGGSLDADVLSFWPKNIEFFEICGVSARTSEEGGLSQCGLFADKERGSIFRNFAGRLLWTALN